MAAFPFGSRYYWGTCEAARRRQPRFHSTYIRARTLEIMDSHKQKFDFTVVKREPKLPAQK